MRSNFYLVDTSVWLEVLPAGQGATALRDRIDQLLAGDLVATTGMVRLELLGGTRSPEEWRSLRNLLSALHTLPVEEGHWDEAAQLGFQLRRQRVTVPFTDLLIGSIAIGANAILVHRDRHFDFMASHLPLRVESYVPA